MGRISRGWLLTKKSWSVLRSNRSLLVFPLLAVVSALGALLVLVAPVAALAAVDAPRGAYVPVAIVAVYALTLATVFFNVALAGCVSKAFDGGSVSVGDGIGIARQRLGAIAGWSLIAATVGLALRVVEDRLPLGGQIAAWLAGVAWAAVTFFAVPVIALEGIGPVAAIKRSASVFKQRWGEQFTGRIAIGAVVAIAIFAALALVAVGVAVAASGGIVPGAVLIAIGVIAIGLTVLVSSAMNQVFGVALYRFATDAQGIGPFTEEDLSNAFQRRRRRFGMR